MFRKTIEDHLGDKMFPMPMDKQDQVKKIAVYASQSKDKKDYLIETLDKKNFSNEALDAMFAGIKKYNLSVEKKNKAEFEIRITSAYFIEEKVNLYIKTNHDRIETLYLTLKTLIEGLKHYRSVMKEKI
jgi:hypothetical protein